MMSALINDFSFWALGYIHGIACGIWWMEYKRLAAESKRRAADEIPR